MPTALGTIASSYKTSSGPIPTTGLQGWWDADALGLANNASVTSWTDRSGNGRTLTVVAGTSAPIYKTAVVNGKAAVSFDNTARALAATSGAAIQHFFIVANFTTPGFTTYNGLLTGVTASNTDAVFVGDGGANWYDFGVPSTYHKNGVLDAAKSACMATVATMSVSATGWNTSFQVQLGRDRDNVGRNWYGYVCEVIAYDRVLSTVERQQVESYLRTKWGTP